MNVVTEIRIYIWESYSFFDYLPEKCDKQRRERLFRPKCLTKVFWAILLGDR